jgi:hypothetical protein
LGLCAAALATINLLQYIFDRQEKFAVLKRDRELAGVTNTVTTKDVTDAGGDGSGDSPKHAGSWMARKLTASNLKRHQAAAAAAATAQPPQVLDGGVGDGLVGVNDSRGDLHNVDDDVAGFGERGFGPQGFGASGGDAYAPYDGPDHNMPHNMFDQPPHQQQQHYQQQQYQPIDADQQFSFEPGPSAAENSPFQQSYGQAPLAQQQQQVEMPPFTRQQQQQVEMPPFGRQQQQAAEMPPFAQQQQQQQQREGLGFGPREGRPSPPKRPFGGF